MRSLGSPYTGSSGSTRAVPKQQNEMDKNHVKAQQKACLRGVYAIAEMAPVGSD